MTTTDDELPRSGPIWTPHASAKDWTPPPGTCSAAARGKRFHPVRCGRVAKVKRRVLDHAGNVLEVEYCGTHDPVRKAERDAQFIAQRKAKWDIEAAYRRQDFRVAEMREQAIELLRGVGDGTVDKARVDEFLREYDEASKIGRTGNDG